MNTFLMLVPYKTRPGVREEFLNKIYASDILKKSIRRTAVFPTAIILMQTIPTQYCYLRNGSLKPARKHICRHFI